MSALYNVRTRGDGAESPSAGFAPSSIPEAKSSPTGASVRYAHDPTKNWYVLRATYERAQRVYDFIVADQKDSDAYIAMHFVKKNIGGKQKRVKEPLVAGLVFVYCTEGQIREYVHKTPPINFVRYYYNRCIVNADGTNPVMRVDYAKMMNFIRVTSVDDDNLMQIDPEYVHYVSGDMVCVTSGKFAGVKGRVARAAGQRRVIVELEGLALIATAYIPAACLEKCE
ncbi:MAG: UpxY family transcription antiterminator [Prevotella sp.]|nr:UpxY family transcription antiterminator [Prevotella sp.]